MLYVPSEIFCPLLVTTFPSKLNSELIPTVAVAVPIKNELLIVNTIMVSKVIPRTRRRVRRDGLELQKEHTTPCSDLFTRLSFCIGNRRKHMRTRSLLYSIVFSIVRKLTSFPPKQLC